MELKKKKDDRIEVVTWLERIMLFAVGIALMYISYLYVFDPTQRLGAQWFIIFFQLFLPFAIFLVVVKIRNILHKMYKRGVKP